jgi:RNA methyltransferase, TrmH family
MNPQTILSIKEEIVLEARALQNAKGRQLAGKFLLEGENQILWALENGNPIDAVFVTQSQSVHPLTIRLEKLNIPVFLCSEGISKKISDTSYLISFIGIVRMRKITQPTKDLVVVLDGVQDFGNIGTIVRTAEAFGIQEFISTKEDFDWFYTKAIDASRGKILSSHLIRYPSAQETIARLKASGYQIAVTTLRESTIQSFAPVEGRPLAIVFGNETAGCCPEMERAADLRIQIPMSGTVESLNVGVAAGISLYELKTKWILSMLTKKIQESIGRDLFCTSQWVRKMFDVKLRASTPFTEAQAVMMMILHCDQASTRERLKQDAGVSAKADVDLQPLIDQNLIIDTNGNLSLSHQGKEAIAKIWSIHELTERLVFADIPDEEKALFIKTLKKIQSNCEKVTPYEA